LWINAFGKTKQLNTQTVDPLTHHPLDPAGGSLLLFGHQKWSNSGRCIRIRMCHKPGGSMHAGHKHALKDSKNGNPLSIGYYADVMGAGLYNEMVGRLERLDGNTPISPDGRTSVGKAGQ